MRAQNPEDVDRLFAEYMNAGDIDGLLGLYEAGAALVVPGGRAATGAAQLREALAGFLAGKPSILCNVTQTVRAGDTAICYNDWTMKASGPDGTPMELRGKAIEVVRRQPDGAWKFVIDDPNARG